MTIETVKNEYTQICQKRRVQGTNQSEAKKPTSDEIAEISCLLDTATKEITKELEKEEIERLIVLLFGGHFEVREKKDVDFDRYFHTPPKNASNFVKTIGQAECHFYLFADRIIEFTVLGFDFIAI